MDSIRGVDILSTFLEQGNTLKMVITYWRQTEAHVFSALTVAFRCPNASQKEIQHARLHTIGETTTQC